MNVRVILADGDEWDFHFSPEYKGADASQGKRKAMVLRAVAELRKSEPSRLSGARVLVDGANVSARPWLEG